MEHSVDVRARWLAAREVTIFVDGARLGPGDDVADLLASLAGGWPRWHLPATALRTVGIGTTAARPARARCPTELERNQQVAAFYAHALGSCPLTAAARTLAKLLPGDIHLAFKTSAEGGIDFATNQGGAGDRFFTATMGAAASNPLLGACHGRVRAISDVLPVREWRGRALYLAARPLVAMEDALGTDFVLGGGWVFHACVIRDNRLFADEDRRAFEMMLAHFRTVLGLSGSASSTDAATSGARRMHVIELWRFRRDGATDPARLRAAIHEHLPAAVAETVAPRVTDWIRHGERPGRRTFAPEPIRVGPSQALAALCVPATAHSDATIILPANLRD